MNSLMKDADQLKEDMAAIEELLHRLHEAVVVKPLYDMDSLKSLRAQISSDIAIFLGKTRAIRDRLEGFGGNERQLSGELRSKLRDVMVNSQGLRERMAAEYKETVGRHYFMVTGEPPEEAVIEKIKSGGSKRADLLKGAIKKHGRKKVVEVVQEIQQWHRAATEIERSLVKLHRLFVEMAVIGAVEGELPADIKRDMAGATAGHVSFLLKLLIVLAAIVLVAVIAVLVLATVAAITRKF